MIKRRLISILLAASIMLTLLPTTALAADETNITSTGLDFSANVPNETTRYTTDGGGAVTWAPTLSDGNVVTGGTLTFENATIQVATGAAASAYAVRLPNAPVKVIFNGTNSIAALNDNNAYAFDCQTATEFVLSPGSATTLTAVKRLGSDDNETNNAAVGVSSVGHNVTVTGGGALNVAARGSNEYAINAGDAAVTLDGCAFSTTHGSKMTASTVTLNGVTVPTGRILNLSGIDTVEYQASNTIEGELLLKAETSIDSVLPYVSGGGLISMGWGNCYFTDGVRFGGDVSDSGLDLSYNTPAVKTGYTTGGKRTIEWEPTLDGNTVRGGKLTLTDANISIEVGTVYFTADIVKLPAVPVTVVLNGTNNFTIENMPDATIAPVLPAPSDNVDYRQFSAFLCLDKTIFMVNGETNINVANAMDMPSYALNNKAHEATVLGPGKLNISTSANAGVDKAEIRSNNVTLGGGVTMSGAVKPASGSGTIRLGNITIPEGKTLDLRAIAITVKNNGESGAVNNGLLVLSGDTGIDVLGLTGTGIVECGISYYTNSGQRISSRTTCIDFNDEEVTWKKTATLAADGYTYSYDAATGVYTITFGNLVIDANSPAPAVTLPDDGKVNVAFSGNTYLMNSGDGAALLFPRGSAAYPCTVSSGGSLMLRTENGACINALQPFMIRGGNIYMEARGASGYALSAPSLAFSKASIISPAGAAFDAATGKIMLNGSPVQSATIGAAAAAATVGAVSVSDTPDTPLAAQELTITLSSEQFKDIAAEQNVTDWFTNIPQGLTAKITTISESAVGISISGTPTAESDAAITITIPAACLTGGEQLTVTVNENARWAISTDPVARNRADVAAAKSAIENHGWTVPQNTANTEEAVKAWIESQLAEMNLNGVEHTVSMTGFIAAVAGTQSDPGGTNGSFSFTVSLSKGANSTLATGIATVSSCIITATEAAPAHSSDSAPSSNPVFPVNGTVYNADRTIWLTGGGIANNDLLIVDSNPNGSEYGALRALANGSDVFSTYNIYLRSGKKSTSSAIYLHFDLDAKYAGEAFTLAHMKADKAHEYFTVTADANGDLAFGPLYELSPFMLVKGTLTQASNARIADVPATGDDFVPGACVGLMLLALLGIAVSFAMRPVRRY